MTETVVRTGTWVAFVDEGVPVGKKTHIVRVQTKDGSIILGTIKWYSPWRCYSFFPGVQTVYEYKCLLEIADFVQGLTKAQRLKGGL